jgi:Cd2+/Zn2+-exporting ATPase
MTPQGSNSPAVMLRWAAGGLLFIVGSFFAGATFEDGGFVSTLSALIALVLLMTPLVRVVVADLRDRKLRMHELVVLAVFASCVQGDFQTSAGIALFMLLSIIVETRTASGAHESLASLATLTPASARRVLPNGEEEEIQPTEVKVGDRLRIRPGDSVVADGKVVSGRTSINEANVTGESLPVDKESGDPVFAGTTNLTGLIEIEVTQVGAETTLGQVRDLIMQAEATRLPVVRMIDQYVRYYTPTVLTVAAVVLYFTRDMTDGLDRVIALLVATCPIALILATPTAVLAALSASARLGVLVKDVNDLEAIARITAVVFDKTGTLTSGNLEVAKLTPVEGVGGADLLAAAAVGGAGSNHPVAGAVRRMASRANVPFEKPDHLHEEPGRGVKAELNGDVVLVGNRKWMDENGVSHACFDGTEEARYAAMSLLFVARNGKALGWIGIRDTIRDDAESCLAAVREEKVGSLAIVSGDRSEVVETVGRSLSVATLRAHCKPADKVTFVNELREQGHRVAFVGDGVNDGPALASSNVGIAMGAAGSGLAIDSATVALMNNELNRLPFLIRLSKRMKGAILQNLAVGGLLVFGGVALAAAGSLSPLAAACLQVAGAIAVSMNSARLIREGEEL